MSGEPVQVNGEGRVAAHLQTARTALQAAYRLIRDDQETGEETTPGQVLDQVRASQDLIDLAAAVQTHRLAQHAGTSTAHGPADDEFLEDVVTGADVAGADVAGAYAAGVGVAGADRAGQKPAGQDPAAPAGRTRWAARGQVSAAEEIDPVRCADVAAVLQWGPRTTARRLREAVTAVNELPDLVDALAEGAIDVARLGAVADALSDLDADARRDAGPVLQHAMLHGRRGGISAWTATSTRQRAKAAVAELDRFVTQQQRRRAISEALGVSFAPGKVRGTSTMTATLTTQQAMLIKNAIEKLAWKYHTTTGDQDATSGGNAPGSSSTRPTGGRDATSGSAPGSSFTRTSSANERGSGASCDSGGDPSGNGSDRSGSSGGRGASFTRAGSSDRAGSGDPAQTARAAGGWGRPGRAGGRSGVGLGACRAQALVDLLSAQAQVSAQATVLVPVNTPDQALVARAIDGLTDLLARQGMILSISTAPEPLSAAEEAEIAEALASLDPYQDYPEHERVDQRPPDQPPGGQEPEPETPAGHTQEPAAPRWGPCSDDPITEHATTMDQLADRLNAITDPHTHPATAGASSTDDPTDTADQAGAAGHTTAAAVDQGWRAGHPDDVTIEGVGIIHAETVTGLINAFGTTIGRALTDPATGTLWEHTTTAYRPPRVTQAFIRLRDQVCRFPGCTRPAEYTDGDHLIPYADGGPTTPANLVCLCRSHHRAKASGAWTTHLDPDGTLHWTALNNQTLTTYPAHEPIPF